MLFEIYRFEGKIQLFLFFLLLMASGDTLIPLGILMGVVLLLLLKPEKVVKITFGSYLLLGLNLALGTCMLTRASHLQAAPQIKILGLSYAKIAGFLLSSLPTVLLVVFGLGLWFFVSNSHLSIRLADDLFFKKVQTLLWSILGVGSVISSVYFSLAYFKGAMYERIFMQEAILPYTLWIPTIGLIIAVVSIIAASDINIRFSIKKEE